jgi:hypothetical protein
MIRTTILFAFLALVTAKTFVASKTKVDNNLGDGTMEDNASCSGDSYGTQAWAEEQCRNTDG